MGVYEHILVGVDGSDASAEAATMAGRLAVDLDAKVTAVYVRQLPAVASSPFGMTMSLGSCWEELERLAAERAAEALDRTGASWRFEVRTGDPAVQLELSADEHGADLVVVGARGHSVAHRLLLGSVSTRLARHARRPVLLVR
jgi:nucleotide-binding universal stress UspA family protein